ncbi:nucleoside deaminase [Roseivivax sediminis]|uniref:tRNA(Arg) A34 adenosine deaminase TadA n=1 Tax=Roseivivax sediminis TaxID=936889 RepID=A0A1I1V7L6_9RHOB|nr:nucleoside deaminase [Roseivivax sediminis]SFD78996.1 tRNA(Arg) A34 adenosine deaminase TadA [Roseivivax sediminis]
MYDPAFLHRAIAISAEALTTPGTEPFGAVVVKDGAVVGEGINRSVLNHDPTSHGETEAIRDAARTLGTVDLRGTQLYSSCEPCPLCVAAMMIAGVSELYYAADMDTAGAHLGGLPESARFPVDVGAMREQCGLPAGDRTMQSAQHQSDRAAEVLARWARHVSGH